MAQALDGIRILDLTSGIAGPLGVLLLAEHGADVIKVERPGGDPFRDYEGYRCWNRSRRSVSIDLAGEAQTFLRLVATADVVVESFRPGVLDRLGLGYDELSSVNPGVVLLSCPAYPDGHRRAGRAGYDALVQATSGQMTDQPGWRNGPIFLHLPLPSMGAAYLVPSAILAALSVRERTGRGQHVRTSLLQGSTLFTTMLWQQVGKPPAGYHELMAKTYPPGIHQPMLFECAKGEWLHYSVMSGLTPVKPLDEIIGFDVDGAGPADERRRDAFRSWDRAELIDELRRNNHAVDPVSPAGDVLDHPQTIANGLRVTVVDPEVGSTTQMGVPIHLLGTPGAVKGPRPRAGQHTQEILADLPPSEPRPAARATPDGPPATPPLAGIRVLDIGQYLAGPFGPMVLSDLGADVVKVEPVGGDSMRLSSKAFIGCQRGKRSVALDLKNPAGLEVAHRLIAGSDIVHHNMTRGVATRLGIDYQACRTLRPDVIYCNTYAYGLPEPLGRFGGLDPLYQASSGIEYDAGAAHTGNPPLYLRFGMCDTSNAMLSVVGVLLALLHRQRTGEGQELWTSLHDGGIFFTSDAWLGPDGAAWERPRLDQGLHGLGARYRLYRTQDDGWICVAALTEAQWEAFGRTLGVDLTTADPQPAFEAACLSRTALNLSRLLDVAGVPNEIPVDSLEGANFLNDADNVRLGLVVEHEHPVLGSLRQFGNLFDFSDTPARIAGPPPLVGQHTREVLRDAGYLDGDIDSLIGQGAAYAADEGYPFTI